MLCLSKHIFLFMQIPQSNFLLHKLLIVFLSSLSLKTTWKEDRLTCLSCWLNLDVSWPSPIALGLALGYIKLRMRKFFFSLRFNDRRNERKSRKSLRNFVDSFVFFMQRNGDKSKRSPYKDVSNVRDLLEEGRGAIFKMSWCCFVKVGNIVIDIST